MSRKLASLLILLCSMSAFGCDDADTEQARDLAKTEQPIVNGVQDYSNPAVVGIYAISSRENGNYEGSTFCTGTLIHPEWILTAAHCVSKRENGSLVQTHDKSEMAVGVHDKSGAVHMFEIADVVFHANYNENYSSANDIAMLKLEKPVTADEVDVAPVLPHPKWLALTSWDLPAEMEIVGFGYDENGNSGVKKSMKVEMTSYCGFANPRDTKSGCYAETVVYSGCHPVPEYCSLMGEAHDYMKTVYIVYGSLYNSKPAGGQCNGDSGGPALYEKGGVHYVSGITSTGDAHCHGYTVDTAVQDFYDWIIEQAPEVASQYKEICGNEQDDDGDGLTDAEDPDCAHCGNGVLNDGEDCDGSIFKEDRTLCTDWNNGRYSAGKVKCDSECRVDYSSCTIAGVCGDGIVSNDEECDGNAFAKNIKTCAKYNPDFSAGTLKCTNDCKIDISECTQPGTCGDGRVDGGEVCDGTKFLGNRYACKTLFPDLYESGHVKCTGDCTYDTSDCVKLCGNGSLNRVAGEVCDGDKFGSATCESLVGTGSTGKLKCTDGCRTIDTSGCTQPAPDCGNGKLDDGEECDGTIFNGSDDCKKAAPKKYINGVLSCNDNCTINYGTCEERGGCGNGKLDDGEECDGTQFANGVKACNDAYPMTYSTGALKCTESCKIDTTACTAFCGNNIINNSTGEICDGTAFPDNADTCEKVVGAGSTGSLACASDCSAIITTGCTAVSTCGDGLLQDDEDCDGDKFLLDEKTCYGWDHQYSAGLVKCSPKCTIDYSACTIGNGDGKCGNGILEDNEWCDGSQFYIESCTDLSSEYISGRLKCTDTCEFDESSCLKAPTQGDRNDMDDDRNELADDNGNLTHGNASNGGSACSSTPMSGAGSVPMGALILGFLGLGAVIRRRRED